MKQPNTQQQNAQGEKDSFRTILITKGIKIRELAYYSGVSPKEIRQACLNEKIPPKAQVSLETTLRNHYGIENINQVT